MEMQRGHRFAGLSTAVLVAVVALVAPAAATAISQPDAAGTVWLCRPGLASNPCTSSRTADAIGATGSATPAGSFATAPTAKKVDCFYVYPTVSMEPGSQADLTIQPAETSVAMAQASRFSQFCQVWAPMYRQQTVSGLAAPDFVQTNRVAFESLLAGWKDYIAHYNDGRPIIFIGHSQGSAMLIKLLQQEIDPSAKLRKLMLSAMLMGGNVTVKNGSDTGGSFKNIRTCGSATQLGCVIAYSSFLNPPPSGTLFGVPGQGVSFLSGQTEKAGLHVVCVNPATFNSSIGKLIPFFGAGTPAPWVTYPGLYTARCATENGAVVLHVTPHPASGDKRPVVTESLGPTWGLHLVDVNIAEGNLVADAGIEVRARLASVAKHAHRG